MLVTNKLRGNAQVLIPRLLRQVGGVSSSVLPAAPPIARTHAKYAWRESEGGRAIVAMHKWRCRVAFGDAVVGGFSCCWSR